MSWSSPLYDMNLPMLTIKLTTTELQYSPNTVSYKLTGECDETSGGCGDDCTPSIKKIPCTSTDYLIDLGATCMCTCSVGGLVCTTTCHRKAIQICGAFQGAQTCTLGNFGTGNCGSCTYKKDWDISGDSVSTYQQGWVQCVYGYDFTNYNNNITTLVNFGKWIIDIYNGTSRSASSGLDTKYKTWLRDASVIYSLISDFYNRIYFTGYYATTPNYQDVFSETDITSSQQIQTYLAGTITNLYETVESLYSEPVQFPSALINLINNLCVSPTPIQTGTTTFTLNFSLNYLQWEAYQSASDKLSYLELLMNAFLRDNLGSISNGKINWTPTSASLTGSPVIGNANVININDYSYESIPMSTFTGNQYTQYLFGTIEIEATVGVWTPMLYCYFASLLGNLLQISTEYGLQIASQAGYNSPNPSIFPSACFGNNLSPSQLKSLMSSYCTYIYTPPPYTNTGVTDAYITTINNKNCLCYASTLAPEGIYGSQPAMCFDSTCSSDVKSAFGLTDLVCTQDCSQMWEWLDNYNQANGGSQSDENLDQAYFTQVCGTSPPEDASQINIKVLLTCIAVIFMFSLLIFSLGKHGDWSNSKIGFTIILEILCLGGLTWFLSRDLAGIGECVNNQGEFQCTSRITKKPIPVAFCNQKLQCECSFNSDCPSGCRCQSSVCEPATGTRPSKEVKSSEPNTLFYVLGLILVFLSGFSLIYLHEDYHWKLSKKTFTIMIVLFMIILIGILTYENYKKKTRTVFTGSCCSSTCESGKCGMSDGCGKMCECPNGQVCDLTTDTCCTVNCEGMCGTTSCGVECGCPEGQTCQNGFCCVKNVCGGNCKGFCEDGYECLGRSGGLSPPYSCQLVG